MRVTNKKADKKTESSQIEKIALVSFADSMSHDMEVWRPCAPAQRRKSGSVEWKERTAKDFTSTYSFVVTKLCLLTCKTPTPF